MKKTKRKLIQTVLAALTVILQCVMPADAGGLVQSGTTVSATLYHRHTNSACKESRWIACGGHWCSNFEYSVGATVYYCSNNHEIPEIHSEYTTAKRSGTHDGEYISEMTCGYSTAGVFKVTRTMPEKDEEESGEEETGEEAGADEDEPEPYPILTASVTNMGSGVSNYSVQWTCPDRRVITGNSVTASQNGVYTATLTWRDAKTGEYFTSALNYTDISTPIHLVFQSDGEPVYETDLEYGAGLPEIEIPRKEGYDFKGYYVGDEGEDEEDEPPEEWYDEEGNRNEDIVFTESGIEQEIWAKWEVRTYTVYYGADRDGDGRGDHEFEATYGEPYSAIPVRDLQKDGYIFDGYYIGNDKVFDADGRPTGNWRWDPDGDIVLRAVYHEKEEEASDGGGSGSKDDDRHSAQQETGVTAPKENVSENSISGNSISDNSISDNGIFDNGGSDDHGGNNASPDDGRTGNGTGGNRDSAVSPDQITEDDGTDGSDSGEEEQFPGLASDGGEEISGTETDEISEEVTEMMTENMASGEVINAGILRAGSPVVKVIEVTGVTAGVLGLVYLIAWLMITKASFAELYAVSPDRKNRRLGAVLILNGENAFHVHIKEKILEKGETGTYRMVFTKRFAAKHANRDIIVHCPKKEIPEIIKPEILLLIE